MNPPVYSAYIITTNMQINKFVCRLCFVKESIPKAIPVVTLLRIAYLYLNESIKKHLHVTGIKYKIVRCYNYTYFSDILIL